MMDYSDCMGKWVVFKPARGEYKGPYREVKLIEELDDRVRVLLRNGKVEWHLKEYYYRPIKEVDSPELR